MTFFSIRSWWTLAHMHTKKCVYQRHMLLEGTSLCVNAGETNSISQKSSNSWWRKTCLPWTYLFWEIRYPFPNHFNRCFCPFPKVGYLSSLVAIFPQFFFFFRCQMAVNWFRPWTWPLTRSNRAAKQRWRWRAFASTPLKQAHPFGWFKSRMLIRNCVYPRRNPSN